MDNRAELLGWCGANALCWRVRRNERRELRFERAQFVHQRVVLGVREGGVVVDVVLDVGTVDLLPEPRNTFLSLNRWVLTQGRFNGGAINVLHGISSVTRLVVAGQYTMSVRIWRHAR